MDIRSDADWDDIKNEYVTTTISTRVLAKKRAVPYSTLRSRAAKEKWYALKEQYRRDVGTKQIAAAQKQAANYHVKLYDIAYKVATQLETLVDSGDMVSLGLKPRDVTGALKDLADVLHLRSDADMREQEARIRKLQRDAEQAQTESTKQLVIRIDPGSDNSEEVPQAWLE